jgi:hypothetical protein
MRTHRAGGAVDDGFSLVDGVGGSGGAVGERARLVLLV